MLPDMKLYFSPLACSLATRIALYEAGAQPELVLVDPRTKLTERGQPYTDIHPLGLVPLLEADDGARYTENAAVLQVVARTYPSARLAPTDAEGLARLQQWLCFIGTELHKSIFAPLLDRSAPPEVKDYALRNVDSRLGWVSAQIPDGGYLLGDFSVADAYLYAVTNWARVTPIRLERWPALLEYQRRVQQRPSVARAFAEELELYRLEQA